MTRHPLLSLKLLAASVTVAIAGAVSLTAFAHDPAPEALALDDAVPHAGHDGPPPDGPLREVRHAGPGMGGPGLPFLDGRHLDHLLDEVDATDAQRTQIRQIAQDAMADLKADRQTARDLHAQVMGVLTAPQVDAAAAEKLRQQMLAQHDRSSKRITQALVDVAKVLTPQQRAVLAQHMKEHAQRMQERLKERRKDVGEAAPAAARRPLA